MSKKEREQKCIQEQKLVSSQQQQQVKQHKVSVIIPIYNEESKVVSKVVSDILNGAGDELLEILVVDDGSEKFDFSYPDTRVKLLKKEHGGKGSAIKFGVEKAKGNILVFTDGDGELLVEWKDIENAVKLMREKNVQAIFGVRRFKGSGSPLWHRFLNRVLSFFVSFITLKWCPDVLCGFRVIRKEDFKNLTVKQKGFGIELGMFLNCVEVENRIIFQSINYTKNRRVNKLNIASSVIFENIKNSLFLKRFVFPFCFFFFLSALFLSNPYSFETFDNDVHIARAKWSIFGENKITVFQKERPLNYSWLYHYVLRKLNFDGETKYENFLTLLLLSKSFAITAIFTLGLNILTSTLPLSLFWALCIILVYLPIFSSFPRVFVQFVFFLSLIVNLKILKKEYLNKKYLLLLGISQVIWANMHVLSFLGFLIPLCFFILTRRKIFLYVFLTCFILNFVSPYGLDSIKYFYNFFKDRIYSLFGSPEELFVKGKIQSPEIFIGEMSSIFNLILLIKEFASSSLLASIISSLLASIIPSLFILLLLFLLWKELSSAMKFLLFILFFGVFFVSLRIILFLPVVAFISANKSKKRLSELIPIGIFTLVSLLVNTRHFEKTKTINLDALDIVNILGMTPECKGKIMSHVSISPKINIFLYPDFIPLADGYTVWNKEILEIAGTIFPDPTGFLILARGGVKCIVWINLEITGEEKLIKKLYSNKIYFLARIEPNF